MRSVYYIRTESEKSRFYRLLTERQYKRFKKKLHKWKPSTGKGFYFYYFDKECKALTRIYISVDEGWEYEKRKT